MINLGNIEIADLRLGSVQVKAAYLGNEQIWTNFIVKGLKFVAEEDNSTIGLKKVGSAPTVYLLTSDNGVDWNQYTVGDSISLPNVGDYVYFKAAQTNNSFASNDYAYNSFFGTGKVGAYGNIEYLRDENASLTSLSQWAYKSLFYNCSALTHAPELTPFESIPYCAYNYLFANCTSLSTGPLVIPALSIQQYGCIGMFEDCSALTAAPEISATYVNEGAFSRMFNRCTSLVKAPSHLYAASIAGRAGYDSMFRDCQSLTASPIIDLTNVSTVDCCKYMFYGCTNLQEVKVPELTQWTSGTTNNWLSGVAATGEFICPEELPDIRGASNIPEGWTKKNPVNYLRITSLEDGSSVQVSAIADARTPILDLQCRKVGTGTWNQYTYGTSLPIDKDEAIEFRAGPNGNKRTSYYNDWPYFNTFIGTGKFAASGNIGTLLQADGNLSSYDSDGTNNNGKNVFNRLFYGSLALIDATQVEFPTLSAPERAFADMFKDCTNLLYAPSCIASTVLDKNALQSFLENTTALSACVKQIDATYLADAATYYFNANSNVKDGVILMGNVTDIYQNNFSNSYGILDFSRCTQVPVLRTSYLGSISKIIVPDALYDAWIVAAYWSNLASKIVRHSDFYPST